MADLEHHKIVARFVQDRFGALDVYLANAGVINLSPTENVTVEDYDRHFAVNTRGVFFGVQAIMPLMRDGGSIIVTSFLSQQPVRSMRTRSMRARRRQCPRSLATGPRSCTGRRIRVNVLSPGPVSTPILAKLGVSEAEQPKFKDMMAGMIPAGRLGEAHELAQAALFLGSDASSFINGIELHVDGGMSLR